MADRLHLSGRIVTALVFSLFLLWCAGSLHAQNAQLTGLVTDPQKAVIRGASVQITKMDTQGTLTAKTNGSGLYAASSLAPGRYRIVVSAPGFETQVINNVELEVAGRTSLTFVLHPGMVSQSVTVDGSGLQINTTDAAVSTVIDRQFVANLPLNGRSFQSLLTLIPGVSVVSNGGQAQVGYGGEVTVNGQRTEANGFAVDGVSANTGAVGENVFLGYGGGYSGSTPGETILGTTQSLVPIDALQEFRATTSTYSAQYGRTPGGQFEFVTRSGTNKFHGNVFDYLRNDVFDANTSINKYEGIARQRERQNDFGGTLGGPLNIPGLYRGEDRTFFFAAYEGLRLQSPQSVSTDVPSYETRASAVAAMQPFLNAFPLPTPNSTSSETNDGNGLALFSSGYSSPSSLNNGSLRIDHQIGERMKLFARYTYTQSTTTGRNTMAPSEVEQQGNDVRGITVGATNFISSRFTNDLRINYTANNSYSHEYMDSFGGATPFNLTDFPVLDQPNANLVFTLEYGRTPTITLTPRTTIQHQVNVVDWMAATVGRHTLKWGIDYRHLANWEDFPSLNEFTIFTGAPVPGTTFTDTVLGLPTINYISKFVTDELEPTFNNFSAFGQDEWKVNSRLNLSLGLRWELNPSPGASNGQLPYALTSTDFSTLALAPQGTRLWHTSYDNFAPRFGLAYQAHSRPGYETTIRAGFGLFYDMPYSTAVQGYYAAGYMSSSTLYYTPFPLSQAAYDALPGASPAPPYTGVAFGFDPHFRMPYTMEWNAAVEQALGEKQSLTLNYVSSAGRRLVTDREFVPANNPNFASGSSLTYTQNAATSSYNALQVKYDRKLTKGLQALLSYTWSHTIDDDTSNFTVFELLRANSDYDIRNNFQVAVTYDLPGQYRNRLMDVTLAHWSLDSRVSARSALPIDVISGIVGYTAAGATLFYHPNRVASQPLYLNDANAPGGRVINFNAYSVATDSQGNDIEGDAGRNSARGFDAVQADLALRKDFTFSGGVGLQFRAEAFNVLNHAIWGNIYNELSMDGPSLFGRAYTMQNTQLGGLNSLYQTGGPRSLQLALKLHF